MGKDRFMELCEAYHDGYLEKGQTDGSWIKSEYPPRRDECLDDFRVVYPGLSYQERLKMHKLAQVTRRCIQQLRSMQTGFIPSQVGYVETDSVVYYAEEALKDIENKRAAAEVEPKPNGPLVSDTDIVNWLEDNAKREWKYGNAVSISVTPKNGRPFGKLPTIREAIAASIEVAESLK